MSVHIAEVPQVSPPQAPCPYGFEPGSGRKFGRGCYGPCGYVWGHHVWPGGPWQAATHVLGAIGIGTALYFLLRKKPQAGVSGLGYVHKRRRRRR